MKKFLISFLILSMTAFAGFANQAPTAEQKAAVMSAMAQIQEAFDKSGDAQTINDFTASVEKLKKIDMSKCPKDVKDKFDAFVKSYSETLVELKKILKDAKINDTADLEKIMTTQAMTNPVLVQKIMERSKDMGGALQQLVMSLIPYMM